MSPPPVTLDKPAVRTSLDMFSPALNSDHPFGKELAQVNEVAEEFGATTSALDEEEQEMMDKGLCKYSVDDYINEIAGLYGGGVFEGQLGMIANPWM